ncbi:Las1-like family protein [Citrus sinensis]|uniref:Las1-like family protein n=1 Tax=Citrus sinensis TaxID=2711 RepID=A0ACB8MWP8_CITSI|nr:Las1-like family protein [Citrus sinensis]
MEPLLGFEDEVMNVGEDKEMSSSSSSSNGYKLVPWLSWDEWDFVRESLFSSSSDKVASALRRISTWRSRGCLPVVIDVTASIIEIQQKDPYYRSRDNEYQAANVLDSDQLLAMLYCMAIMRLVNCVVEKTRRKTEASIAEAANAIGIPRKLIDVRHEGSHRDLPALQVVRDCSDKALDWLQAYYWEPQKNQIPLQRDGAADIRREIKSKLQELAFCLKMKQNPQLGPSLMKGKRLCGRNKFISVMTGKLPSSKSGGSNKKWTKCLKNLVKLYSTLSSEIVSVLLEFLLNAFDDSSNLEFPNDSHVVKNVQTSLDDWKPVITKFSNKEPELLLSLLKAVLHMIENEEAKKYETGGQSLTSTEYGMGTYRMEHLSYLFAWLVGLLEGLKSLRRTNSSAERNISNSFMVELLRKCLLLSATGNKLLVDSSLHLAQLVGNLSITEKLRKLSLICLSHLDGSEENSSLSRCEDMQEDIPKAAKKLEFVKRYKMKRKVVMTADGDVGNRNRWVLAKSWNSCPIGMLPHDLGSSGRLPILDCDDRKQSGPQPVEKNEIMELNQYGGKREASCDIQLLDNSSIKKMKETVEVCQLNTDGISLFDDSIGHLMIGGVWKKVSEQELETIKSRVRILI